jgi:hypothetical protein
MRLRGIVLAMLLLGTLGCSRTVYEAHFATPSQIAKITEAGTRSPFIKVHMPDGRVFVLERWAIEEGAGTIEGTGLEYSANRVVQGRAHHVEMKLTDAALIETNRPYDVDVGTGSIIAMIIGTSASFVFSIVCFAAGSVCYK